MRAAGVPGTGQHVMPVTTGQLECRQLEGGLPPPPALAQAGREPGSDGYRGTTPERDDVPGSGAFRRERRVAAGEPAGMLATQPQRPGCHQQLLLVESREVGVPRLIELG